MIVWKFCLLCGDDVNLEVPVGVGPAMAARASFDDDPLVCADCIEEREIAVQDAPLPFIVVNGSTKVQAPIGGHYI